MTTEPTPDTAAPADWIDGHLQLEAIAAAVWEQCGRSDSGACVEDDPRNIAVAAYAAVLPLLPEPADRAAVLLGAAERVLDAEHLPFVSPMGRKDVAALLRRLADEAQPAEPVAPATLTGRVARSVAEDASALRMDLYDDVAAFARETGNTGLQHAQIRDHLTEFLFERLLRRLAGETPATTGEAHPPTADYSVESFDGEIWGPISFRRPTLAEAQFTRDANRSRFPEGWPLRIVRWDETATVVESDEPAAVPRQDGAR